METTVTSNQSSTAAHQRLKDRVAIVTGSAQGIGFAIAELFSREGAKVVLVDVDNQKVSEAARGLTSQGFEALGVACDVTKFESCEDAVKETVAKFGKIDILINNAGVTRDNLLMRMSDADWDLVLNINLKGPFNFTKAAIRPMLKAHYGRIVNIASVVGEEGNAGQANYAASKGGLISFTKTCAKEFASRNILCNAVAPGFVKTRMTDMVPEAERQKFLSGVLLGRIGEPIEIAKAVLFLASDDSSYITGHVLNVNGGGYM